MSLLRFENISQFSNMSDYLPLFNAVLLTDIGVILLMLTGWIKGKMIRKWYDQYNLSAVIADVLIIFLDLILVRFLYPFVFSSYSLWKFIGLAVGIQVVHDFAFYFFVSSVPVGMSRILNTFRDYGKENGVRAVIADSQMIISACILGSLFKSFGTNANFVLLVVLVYLVPYLIYT